MPSLNICDVLLNYATVVTIQLAPVLSSTVATANFLDLHSSAQTVIEVLNKRVGIRERY